MNIALHGRLQNQNIQCHLLEKDKSFSVNSFCIRIPVLPSFPNFYPMHDIFGITSFMEKCGKYILHAIVFILNTNDGVYATKRISIKLGLSYHFPLHYHLETGKIG